MHLLDQILHPVVGDDVSQPRTQIDAESLSVEVSRPVEEVHLDGGTRPLERGAGSEMQQSGVRNLAPHSYFNVVAHEPPHVVFSSSGVKDTLRNVRTTGEFVVNLVSLDVVEQMNFTATDFPPDQDEFTWAQVTAVPSQTVAPPRVAEARAHLECRVKDIVPAGNGNIVIGEVTHIHVDPSVWRDGRIDPELLDPVCRLAGTRYATLGEVFKLDRPSWSDVEGTGPGEAIPRR